MKILEIIENSAALLGLSEEAELLKTATEENEHEVLQDNHNIERLFNLCRFSIRELCTNYVPVVVRETIQTVDGKYAVGLFENFIRIQNVFENETMVKFKIINRNLVFERDGEYTVQYATYPTISSMFEDLDFLQNLNPDVLVFGLCAYFALAHGMFDQFKEFHEKYVSRAESLKDLKIFELPCRRWE
jgi:hypothetical protein